MDIIHSMNYQHESPADAVTQTQLRQFQELISSLMQCCQQRAQYQSERFGLPDAELRCLLLFEGQRYLTPGNIAMRMNVAKSRVSRIVDGLRGRGLVRRTPDPEDSRVSLLSLTPEGQDRLEQVRAFLSQQYRTVLERFPADQRSGVIGTLGSLKLAMESVRDLLP